MRKTHLENCQHGFICASCVQCRKASFYRWIGKPTRNRTVITLSIEVATRKEDSLEVLADALAGDATNALLGVHKIPACRIRQILYYSPEEARRRGIPELGHEMPAHLAPKERQCSMVASRVAIYARVSTTHHGQDVSMQTRELREYAERRGWIIFAQYVDEGISGAKDSRPELNRLMADAHKRRFDVVCVWRFDRFARSVSHLLRALETFKALGIDFVSFSEQMDTSTPAGKMVFTVLGAVAELERSLIVERVRAGLRNARAKGKNLGRPRVAVDAAKIATLRASGASWQTITLELGVSAGTAKRAFYGLSKNPRVPRP